MRTQGREKSWVKGSSESDLVSLAHRGNSAMASVTGPASEGDVRDWLEKMRLPPGAGHGQGEERMGLDSPGS